jgi:hypothetical protein
MSSDRRTRTWPEIAAFYQALIQDHGRPYQPMVALVEFLSSPRYGRALFACTSHETLLIGRVPDFIPGDGELQIRFDGKEQQFTFTYLLRPDDPTPWVRECAASEWRRVLERVLHKRLQWFHEG